MAEISKFFNSAPGDPRTYQASDFADYFGSVLSTGLLHKDNVPGLSVSVEVGTLNTIVSPGKAIIKGYLYENTTSLTLTHSIPEPTLDRIDRIVLRLDLRNSERNIKLHVKEGMPDTDPVPPALQRDDFIYELSLAQVRVQANTVQLSPSNLIDERLNDEVCGLTYSLISGPLGDLTANIVRILDLGNYYQTVNVEEALKELKKPLSVYKSNEDSNGIFTKVTWKDATGLTVKTSELSNPDADGNYLTRTVKLYNSDGVTVMKTLVYTLTYNTDGVIVSEVLSNEY
ncbi:hypothetical protein NST17_21070 [Caldifermentibacillus hisashii]|uniref:Uncharacterized protein n=1 Tax=Caldifermentibacillus hisashii TaxID=996558 RepID=A0ABU9K3F9_9BACI